MSPIHFLLVDDERILIEAVAERLRLKGQIVDISISGAEALTRLKTCNTIDIVVLYIQMNGEDGLEILNRIRAEYPLVEVIIVTDNASIQSAIDAMKLGAFNYLIKPVDFDDLLANANNAVIKKRNREEKIFNVRIRPYLSPEEKNEMISKILEE